MTKLRHTSLLLLAIALLPGCSSIRYYSQAISGQVELMWSAHPIDEWLTDPATPPDLARKLSLASAVRTYARDHLALPVDQAYAQYADFQRQYVVVNLVAVPEFSLAPYQWCYPIVGCQSYRGYFSADDARTEQADFVTQGFDTFIGGVTAYSTLGWFDDPLHPGFTRLPDDRMAALMFHELTHRVVYIAGDTAFNESFATAVELEGLRQWLNQQGDSEAFQRALLRLEQRNQTLTLVTAASARLEDLYARQDQLQDDQLRTAKADILTQLRADYLTLSADWQEPGPFGRDPAPFNNAHLALFQQYNQYVPAFRQLISDHNYRFGEFYQAVEALSKLPQDQRNQQLSALAQRFHEHL